MTCVKGIPNFNDLEDTDGYSRLSRWISYPLKLGEKLEFFPMDKYRATAIAAYRYMLDTQ
jgi:hypothetical protein